MVKQTNDFFFMPKDFKLYAWLSRRKNSFEPQWSSWSTYAVLAMDSFQLAVPIMQQDNYGQAVTTYELSDKKQYIQTD